MTAQTHVDETVELKKKKKKYNEEWKCIYEDPKLLADAINRSKKVLIKKFNNHLDGEFIIDKFVCSLSAKILLSGAIHLTNKRVLFRSLFNDKTLFGKGRRESIPYESITHIEKRCFANMKMFPNTIFIRTGGD